jgi:hypothetical protein
MRSNAGQSRFSSAHVISLLALFVALGGSAWAVTAGKNTVTSKSIKKGAVKTVDLAKNAATGAKVKESSLGAVPNATNAGNADSLDGLDSTAFESNSAVVGGTGDPTQVSATMLTVPNLLEILTDSSGGGSDQIQVRNLGSASIVLVFDASNSFTLNDVATLSAGGNGFDADAEPGLIEFLADPPSAAPSVVTCFFPGVQPDYCQVVTPT